MSDHDTEYSNAKVLVPHTKGARVIVLTTAALVVSVALNVVLAHKVRTLTQAQSVRAAERLLQIGAMAPPIPAKRLRGSQEVISYEAANQATVLYFFTPSCAWCARNFENFRTLVDQNRSQYRFIAVSLSDEGLLDYAKTHELKIPIYEDLSTESKTTYKLAGTPQTIVISPQGRVLQNWMGAYVGEQKSQVEAFFHVNLPGVQSVSK